RAASSTASSTLAAQRAQASGRRATTITTHFSHGLADFRTGWARLLAALLVLVVASTSLHPALRAGPTLAELQRAATGGDGGAPATNDDLALQQPVAHLRGLGEARLDPARPTGSADPKPPGLAAAAPVLAHAPRAPPQ